MQNKFEMFIARSSNETFVKYYVFLLDHIYCA